ncbi:MAG: dihydrolipoyl dehydrogenase [Chloroflexi bacterium]|nr:dihydrolipoyl dehydrogenase [Chloroflexota bacterium]
MNYDVVILGAGPGGYVAAIRASQLGLKTAILEKEAVGGLCLNWGCIPSKALLRNAQVLGLVKKANQFGIKFDNLQYDFGEAIDRSRDVVKKLTNGIELLLKKNKIDNIKGTGLIEGVNSVKVIETGEVLSAKNIIISTGARQRQLPGINIDHNVVMTSRDALEAQSMPENVIIVGGGATGVEFAHIYHTYGAQVKIIELMPRIIPSEDLEISKNLERSFKKRGIEIITDCKVNNIELDNNIATLSLTKDGVDSIVECDRVLVSVGMQGNIDNIGIEAVNVNTDKGFIVVDENMKTNIPNIYAIGDVTGNMLLAHVASAQAIVAVETIVGLNPAYIDYNNMPRAIYCEPQVASFGISENDAIANGLNIKVGKFPLSASGKALALAETSGMCKLIVDNDTDELLGAHMIGAEVTELLGELGIIKALEGTAVELGALVHPHPTISEVVKEAALNIFGEAIHI